LRHSASDSFGLSTSLRNKEDAAQVGGVFSVYATNEQIYSTNVQGYLTA
jgi:hypothetical protein